MTQLFSEVCADRGDLHSKHRGRWPREDPGKTGSRPAGGGVVPGVRVLLARLRPHALYFYYSTGNTLLRVID